MADGLEDLGFEDETAALEALGFEEESQPEASATATPAERLRTAGKRPPKDPGLLRSVGHSILSGFFKDGADEAMGGLGALKTGEPMPGAVWRETGEALKTQGDVYRAARDSERRTLEGAREHYPKTAFLAQMAGDVGSDMVLSALGVPGAGTPAYNVAVGALSGFLGSDAELTGPEATTGDALSAGGSTLLGAGLGYVAPKVGQGLAKFAPAALARLRNALEDTAINQGRRVLENVSTTMSKNRKPTSDAAVRQALQDRAIRMFGSTEGTFERLEELASQRGASYGSILEGLQREGVRGPEAEALAKELFERGKAARRVSGANTSVADYYDASAEAVLKRPDPGQTSLALDQAEQTKRNLQKEAKLDRLNMTGLDEAKADVAHLYKDAIEETVANAGRNAPPNSELAELASEFEPMKRLLARTIEAREAAKLGASAGKRRSAVGLSDRLAGNTAAAANLGPGGILAATLGNMLARNRGTSTVARASYAGSRAANALARLAINNPGATSMAGNELGAVAGRSSTSSLARLLGLEEDGESPSALEAALTEALLRRKEATP